MRGGRSPLIIRDLDVYPQHPQLIGAPTLNSEEPHNSAVRRSGCITEGGSADNHSSNTATEPMTHRPVALTPSESMSDHRRRRVRMRGNRGRLTVHSRWKQPLDAVSVGRGRRRTQSGSDAVGVGRSRRRTQSVSDSVRAERHQSRGQSAAATPEAVGVPMAPRLGPCADPVRRSLAPRDGVRSRCREVLLTPGAHIDLARRRAPVVSCTTH